MRHYTIEAKIGTESYLKEFKDDTEARHWVINHLDLSREWMILRVKNKLERG